MSFVGNFFGEQHIFLIKAVVYQKNQKNKIYNEVRSSAFFVIVGKPLDLT